MLQELKKEVFEANLDLFKQGMVIFTWGNVSGIDRDQNIMAIKPSGIDYNVMQVSDIVLVDLEGKVVEGKLNPSSDTPTHLELYKGFPGIRGIVHTHSTYATAWAQAGKPIPLIGTTQADYFARDIPSFLESLMVLSSTSVRFMACLSLNPLNLSQRLSMSAAT